MNLADLGAGTNVSSKVLWTGHVLPTNPPSGSSEYYLSIIVGNLSNKVHGENLLETIDKNLVIAKFVEAVLVRRVNLNLRHLKK